MTTDPLPDPTSQDAGARLPDLAVQVGEALGRSRGRLTSTGHLAVDGRGQPMSVVLTGGQAGDNPQLRSLLDAIQVPRVGGGRPRTRPDHLIARPGLLPPAPAGRWTRPRSAGARRSA